MAYVTEIFTAPRSLKDRLGALRKSFAEARAQRRVYDRTLAELRALTERELADLGISAAEIPYIAREAAYGTN